MILGIDEAGRGPVLGPMVLCGVWIHPGRERALVSLGVRDSKAYGSTDRSRARRDELARQIRALAAAVLVEVSQPEEIDRWRADGGLNRLERELAARIIAGVPAARRIVADGARLFGPLSARYPQLEAVDRADSLHPVVAAASIVAKAERDRLLSLLLGRYEREFGPIRGGGYPNPATAAFLRDHVARHSCLPDGVRRSWSWEVLQRLVEPT